MKEHDFSGLLQQLLNYLPISSNGFIAI